MPTFQYVAKARSGQKQSGSMQAENRQQALIQLTNKGLTLEKLTEQKTRVTAKGNKRVKTTDLLIFTRQLSTIVSAGLPLLQGLDILAEQTDDPNFRVVIDAVATEVESGETFSDALRKFPKAFPDLYVSMVRSGEAGGDLDGVLLQLADYLEASEDLKRRIKSAMTYPVVAFSMIMSDCGGPHHLGGAAVRGDLRRSSARSCPRRRSSLINMSAFLRTWYAVADRSWAAAHWRSTSPLRALR
jgi:type IV pilus assembly protein PilC